MVGGVSGGSQGVNVHNGDEAGTPRTTGKAPYVDKNFILVKSGCYKPTPLEESRPEIQEALGNSSG
jgi:hypothetical protein